MVHLEEVFCAGHDISPSNFKELSPMIYPNYNSYGRSRKVHCLKLPVNKARSALSLWTIVDVAAYLYVAIDDTVAADRVEGVKFRD